MKKDVNKCDKGLLWAPKVQVDFLSAKTICILENFIISVFKIKSRTSFKKVFSRNVSQEYFHCDFVLFCLVALNSRRVF